MTTQQRMTAQQIYKGRDNEAFNALVERRELKCIKSTAYLGNGDDFGYRHLASLPEDQDGAR